MALVLNLDQAVEEFDQTEAIAVHRFVPLAVPMGVSYEYGRELFGTIFGHFILRQWSRFMASQKHSKDHGVHKGCENNFRGRGCQAVELRGGFLTI